MTSRGIKRIKERVGLSKKIADKNAEKLSNLALLMLEQKVI